MVADPQQLRTIAARLRAEAERVRHLALRAGAAREVPWRSAAASAFRQRVGECVAGLRGDAAALDDAAVLVQQHAVAAEGALDAAEAAARAVLAQGESVLAQGESMLREARRAVHIDGGGGPG